MPPNGLVFDSARATARTIRDEDQYIGVRVSLAATLSNARLSLHVDVNVGDPIWPAPTTVQVQRLLGGSITAGADLDRCLREVATYRQAALQPLSTVLDGYATIGRQGWTTWRRRNQLDELVPATFDDLLSAVLSFADPVLTARTPPRRWDPGTA